MPNPYSERIQNQRQRIRQHSGDDSQLRDRLNQLRKRRAQGGGQGGGKGNGAFSPTPWNAQYESSIGAANQNLALDEANYAGQEQSLQKSYGFNDSSDPFSRASMLQQQFANANRGTLNNYAAAGQLYAGSTTNARGIDRQNFEQNWDASQKDFQSRLYDLAQQRLQSQAGHSQSVVAAEAARLEDALQERVDPAEAPAGKNKNDGKGGKDKNDKDKDKPKGKGKNK